MRKLCLQLVNEFTSTVLSQHNAMCVLEDLIRNCLQYETMESFGINSIVIKRRVC